MRIAKHPTDTTHDIRAFDTAKVMGGALIPASVMDRIWDGENRVVVLREWRGLKQGDLAKASGLSQAYVCEIEKGKNVSARAAKALAKALDVDVGDLLAA
ncbi:MAG: helix-turn-helix transcriptional regulator [Rhodospirillaceae bacterium]|nr:helix-turn-helix transcriptional regulator [Rhodospirillaceae bacterium]